MKNAKCKMSRKNKDTCKGATKSHQSQIMSTAPSTFASVKPYDRTPRREKEITHYDYGRNVNSIHFHSQKILWKMKIIASTRLLGHEGSMWATSLTVGSKQRGLEGGTERAQPSRAWHDLELLESVNKALWPLYSTSSPEISSISWTPQY